MAQEFVAISQDGIEFEWVDPYDWHKEIMPGLMAVSNGHHVYEINLAGGCTYVIREREGKTDGL